MEDAHYYLNKAGYRIIKEAEVDIYTQIEDILSDRGYSMDDIQQMMADPTIENLIDNGYDAVAVADELEAGCCVGCDEEDETTELELAGDRYGELDDYVFDESYIQEGKSRGKSDKFSHKEKVANKKKKCYDCDDDDCELDESYDNEINKPSKDEQTMIDAVEKELKACKIRKEISNSDYEMILLNGDYIQKCFDCANGDSDYTGDVLTDAIYIVDQIISELAGDIDESLEDTFREPNTVQQGTDDWSDFKDNFRAKTLLLKKALTPKFVSELIKRTDFEVDDKEIKAYAISIIEKANLDAKDPVQALQKRIKAHFEK